MIYHYLTWISLPAKVECVFRYCLFYFMIHQFSPFAYFILEFNFCQSVRVVYVFNIWIVICVINMTQLFNIFLVYVFSVFSQCMCLVYVFLVMCFLHILKTLLIICQHITGRFICVQILNIIFLCMILHVAMSPWVSVLSYQNCIQQYLPHKINA